MPFIFEHLFGEPRRARAEDKRDTSSLMEHYGGGYWKKRREKEAKDKAAKEAADRKAAADAKKAAAKTKQSRGRKKTASVEPSEPVEAAPPAKTDTSIDAPEVANKEPEEEKDITAPVIAEVSIFKDFKCVVCLDEVKDPTSTFCGHIFCEECILASINSAQRCPTCRCKLTKNEIHPLFV